MRRSAIAVLLVAAVFGGGCQSSGPTAHEPVVQHHFVGLTALARRADMAPLASILASTESQQIIQDTSGKLAARLPGWLGGAEASQGGAGLQSLVRRLLESETFLEVRADARGVTDWAIAARLDGAAGAVGAELRQALGTSAGEVVDTTGGGWEARAKGASAGARFAVSGPWAILGNGAGSFDALQARIQQNGAPAPAPTNYLYRVDAKLARLAEMLHWPKEPPGPVRQWPQVQVMVEPRNGRLRTKADMDFGRPLELDLVPWEVPAPFITEPIVGFTAIQGADTWLKRLAMFAANADANWPKQLFLWSLAGRSYQQYVAAPMDKPAELLEKVAPSLPSALQSAYEWPDAKHPLSVTNNAGKYEIRGLPWVAPFLSTAPLTNKDVLVGGLFFPLKGQLAPNELMDQVRGRTNLVFYDWEVTGRSVQLTNRTPSSGLVKGTNYIGRLPQIRDLVQLALGTKYTPAQLALTRSGEIAIPGWNWIMSAMPYLGETITEVTRTSPSRLSLTRQSQVGFNALEIIQILRWLENPGFPGWKPAPPPPPPAPAPVSGAGAKTPAAPPVPKP
ncbi:MAG: hypothetical protein JNK85_28490 [Verrucomicrobiales bacterium]|nr:hypothetical protein [Verrucomicrobiales bacterium]